MDADRLFIAVFEHTIGLEGRYCNDPRDSGGETCWGITRRVAAANGYSGPMATMPRDIAQKIYEIAYWRPLKLHVFGPDMPKLAGELFDAAVNCGLTRAASWLQRALNALNVRGGLYHDIPVDGQLGNVTLGALQALRDHRGDGADLALAKLVDCQQGCYYLELAERREKDERFVYGWVMNRLGVQA